MQIQRLILASTSPFRRGLVRQAGMPFEPGAPECDESLISGDSPSQLAANRAAAKSLSVSCGPGTLVLGADQVLGFAGESFDKVTDRESARIRLERLCGNTHVLFSAYALACDRKILMSRVVEAEMSMRSLSPEDIEAYLDTKEWQGSVGCYQFENRGAALFQPVSVDSTVIVGMPVVHLHHDLRRLGIDLLRDPDGPWTLA